MSNLYELPIFSWFIYNKFIWKNNIYLMCTLFCKSQCVINVGSPYGLNGDPIYI